MTDYERLRILFLVEQKSIIETMDAMYYAQSIPELNSLKRELSKKTKTLAFKKEEMLNLYIDNLNAGGI